MSRRRSRHAPPAAALLVIALLVQGRGALADPADPWLGRDKALHFSISAGIAGAGYGGAAPVTDDRRWRLLTGASLAIAAGAGKEILDAYGLGDASWKDLTWDLIGTATGLGVAWLVDRLISGSRGPGASRSWKAECRLRCTAW